MRNGGARLEARGTQWVKDQREVLLIPFCSFAAQRMRLIAGSQESSNGTADGGNV